MQKSMSTLLVVDPQLQLLTHMQVGFVAPYHSWTEHMRKAIAKTATVERSDHA